MAAVSAVRGYGERGGFDRDVLGTTASVAATLATPARQTRGGSGSVILSCARARCSSMAAMAAIYSWSRSVSAGKYLGGQGSVAGSHG
jgi:hypothetical protein